MRIDEYGPGIRRKPTFNTHLLAERAVEQIGHVADQLATFDPFGKQRFRAGEGQQTPGQRGGAGCALHRVGEVVHHFLARAAQPPPGKVDPADDDREHIVEIMRDPAGQLADCFHLLHLA